MHKKSISSLSGPRSDLHSFTIAFKGLVGLVVLMSSHLPFHSVYFCFGRTCGCRDQLSQEGGVVDKMQVFRPDRVFMVQKKTIPHHMIPFQTLAKNPKPFSRISSSIHNSLSYYHRLHIEQALSISVQVFLVFLTVATSDSL
jgi:hypothetical protein